MSEAVLFTYGACYFAFDVEASVKDVGKVRNREGVVVLRERVENATSNKRHLIYFTSSEPHLRACDFRLPSTWWVGLVNAEGL